MMTVTRWIWPPDDGYAPCDVPDSVIASRAADMRKAGADPLKAAGRLLFQKWLIRTGRLSEPKP
jgi:hypothetical protein